MVRACHVAVSRGSDGEGRKRPVVVARMRNAEDMHESFDTCYRAVRGRDRRFDGRFVTAVRTTRIHRRPSGRAQAPKRENVTFYPHPAAAAAAGYRACKRCRPDAAPG